MATIAPVEQEVLLHNVSWETYERLLAEHTEAPGTHFIYDQGELEMEFCELGSTTFKREYLQKGFEPDSAFYFGPNAVAAEERDDSAGADAEFPPDLIIEVEISTPCVNRFPIFAAFGIPELWRYTNSRVIFYRLENGQYVEISNSLALPPVTAADITRLLDDRKRMRSLQWARHAEGWVHQLR